MSKVTVRISMTYRAQLLTIPLLSTASKEKLQSEYIMLSVVEIIISEHRTIINNIFNTSPSKYIYNKHHYPESRLIIKCASFIFNKIRNIT